MKLQLQYKEEELKKAQKRVDDKNKQVKEAYNNALALVKSEIQAKKIESGTANARGVLADKAIETLKKLEAELKTLENQLQNLKSEFQVFSNRVSKQKVRFVTTKN